MPAKEYTVGIPVATVIFLSLIIASYVILARSTPSESERRDESVFIITELRTRAPGVLPPNNDDQTGPTVYAETDDNNVTTLRVYGLIPPDRQRRVVDVLREVRAEHDVRPVIVHFHYPRARAPDAENSPSQTPTAEERPNPFKTVRIDGARTPNGDATP